MCDIVEVVFFGWPEPMDPREDLVLTKGYGLGCGICPIAHLIRSPKTCTQFETGTIGAFSMRV